MPVPRDWARACATLAPLAERAIAGEAPSDLQLFEAAAEAYGVGRDVVAPLVAWAAR
jgi:hypothetical protein